MTRIKVCGCMRPEDAIAATKAGADFVGMVFVRGVRREVSSEDGKFIVEAVRESSGLRTTVWSEHEAPPQATPDANWFERWSNEIARRLLERRPLTVGVFANQQADYINEVAEECDLDLIQFSGDESWEMALSIVRPVFKSVKVRAGWTMTDVMAEIRTGAAAMPLLEPHVEGLHGGAGVATDWTVARDVAAKTPLVLAGGLTPTNVVDAVTTVRPWGVDVSSGVETDGAKDPLKIEAFVAAVRSL